MANFGGGTSFPTAMGASNGSKGTEDASRRSAARVRDNQRRSRERHKAFVEDLQKRVQEYEQRGVQATLDMQQAARTVALENSRLRLLLRKRGVADDEVDEFLKSFSEESPPKGAKRAKRTRKQTETAPAGETLRQEQGNTEPGGASEISPLVFAIDHHPSGKLSVLADASAQQDCCGGKTRCTMPSEEPRIESSAVDALGDPGMDTRGTPYDATPDSLSSPTTMSCTAAAQIVADMQGHGDSDLAKATLGCGDRSDCVVKNTALFQILERDSQV